MWVAQKKFPSFVIVAFNSAEVSSNTEFLMYHYSSNSKPLKDTLKAFNDFKNKQKSVWSNIFWYIKVCIFWGCIRYTMHRDKTNVKKFSFRQNKRYKKCPLFFLGAPTHHIFTLNLPFLYKLKHNVCPSEDVWEILHFRFPFVFINVYILFNEIHGLFNFRTS